MQTYTLDTNCIIALEQSYPEAASLRRLIAMHDQKLANVRVVAIAASERQKGGAPLENFSQFVARLEAIGLQHIEVLKPPCYAGISFVDWSIAVEGDLLDLEKRIYEVLFSDFAYDSASAIDDSDPKAWKRWVNAKCDVLTAWCHIYYRGDVFVTSDKNFLRSKKPALISLGMREIKSPSEVPETQSA